MTVAQFTVKKTNFMISNLTKRQLSIQLHNEIKWAKSQTCSTEVLSSWCSESIYSNGTVPDLLSSGALNPPSNTGSSLCGWLGRQLNHCAGLQLVTGKLRYNCSDSKQRKRATDNPNTMTCTSVQHQHHEWSRKYSFKAELQKVGDMIICTHSVLFYTHIKSSCFVCF